MIAASTGRKSSRIITRQGHRWLLRDQCHDLHAAARRRTTTRMRSLRCDGGWGWSDGCYRSSRRLEDPHFLERPSITRDGRREYRVGGAARYLGTCWTRCATPRFQAGVPAIDDFPTAVITKVFPYLPRQSEAGPALVRGKGRFLKAGANQGKPEAGDAGTWLRNCSLRTVRRLRRIRFTRDGESDQKPAAAARCSLCAGAVGSPAAIELVRHRPERGRLAPHGIKRLWGGAARRGIESPRSPLQHALDLPGEQCEDSLNHSYHSILGRAGMGIDYVLRQRGPT